MIGIHISNIIFPFWGYVLGIPNKRGKIRDIWKCAVKYTLNLNYKCTLMVFLSCVFSYNFMCTNNWNSQFSYTYIRSWSIYSKYDIATPQSGPSSMSSNQYSAERPGVNLLFVSVVIPSVIWSAQKIKPLTAFPRVAFLESSIAELSYTALSYTYTALSGAQWYSP